MNKLFLILGALAILTAGAVLKTQVVYAQISKDPGASGLAPSVNPQTPGWDPGLASSNAPKADPDQAAHGWKPMEAPGQQALTAGIIGPELKK